MKDSITNLLKVKSLMTLTLTLVFCAGALIQMCTSVEIPQALVQVYMAVVAFYFGTQASKTPNEDSIKYIEDAVINEVEEEEIDQDFSANESAREPQFYE